MDTKMRGQHVTPDRGFVLRSKGVAEELPRVDGRRATVHRW
jgi:hypothetical protein